MLALTHKLPIRSYEEFIKKMLDFLFGIHYLNVVTVKGYISTEEDQNVQSLNVYVK